MKITKYPQSCMLLEQDGGRILIDPGNFAVDAYSLDDFGEVDAVLYTHRHADHFDDRLLDGLRDQGVQLIGNADVSQLLGDGATVVTDGDDLTVAGFAIAVRDLPHVPMVDGSPGPPNTGYLIDGVFFHPGDGMEIADVRVETLAVPIAGPSISFYDAYRLVQSTRASTAIPIHYDFFLADPDHFARACDLANIVVLGHGESTTL